MMLVFVHVFYPGCALICFLVSGLPCAFLSGARFFGGLVGVVPLRLLLLSLDFSRVCFRLKLVEYSYLLCGSIVGLFLPLLAYFGFIFVLFKLDRCFVLLWCGS